MFGVFRYISGSTFESREIALKIGKTSRSRNSVLGIWPRSRPPVGGEGAISYVTYHISYITHHHIYNTAYVIEHVVDGMLYRMTCSVSNVVYHIAYSLPRPGAATRRRRSPCTPCSSTCPSRGSASRTTPISKL